jgi:TRAP-type C4-dicarboxylate transport system permease large subunit
MVRPLIPFYLTMFVTLMLITYIPQIAMWLPGMISK